MFSQTKSFIFSHFFLSSSFCSYSLSLPPFPGFASPPPLKVSSEHLLTPSANFCWSLLPPSTCSRHRDRPLWPWIHMTEVFSLIFSPSIGHLICFPCVPFHITIWSILYHIIQLFIVYSYISHHTHCIIAGILHCHLLAMRLWLCASVSSTVNQM